MFEIVLVFVLLVLAIAAIFALCRQLTRKVQDPTTNTLGCFMTLMIILTFLAAIGWLSHGCTLDSEALEFKRPQHDPCCFRHGGTCGWYGAKVIPICCDSYVARECAQRGEAGGAP